MNKKLIFIGVIIIAIFIIILNIVLSKNKEEITSQYQVFDIYQVFELEDIDKSEFEIERSKDEEFSTKYML